MTRCRDRSVVAALLATTLGAAGYGTGSTIAYPARATSRTVRDTTTDLALDLNIPAYRLVVRELGTVTHSYAVTVGAPASPTPVGDFRIDLVVWNPTWLPSARDSSQTMERQEPGTDDVMVRVKMHLTDLVFMHGSPLIRTLGSAASSTCVRLSNRSAIALARIVHRHASPELASDVIDSLESDRIRAREISLHLLVPIRVRYQLADIRGDTIEMYPDIYPRLRHDARADALLALRQHGIDSLEVDRVRLGRLLRRARHERLGVLVRTLRMTSATGHRASQAGTFVVVPMNNMSPAHFSPHRRGS